MLSTRWQKLWLVSALLLLFFPTIFILMEVPTEAKILHSWSTSLLWKIQDEIPEYRAIGIWYLRQQYADLSDRELIGALENRFNGMDSSQIRQYYVKQIDLIPVNRFLVIAEAATVYACVAGFLYTFFWFFARVFQAIRSIRSASIP